jgi:DNA-binding NtrC family response regulator
MTCLHQSLPDPTLLPAPRTVLIVEDEPAVRLGLATILADMGHRVIEASNAFEALQVLESDEPLDLLVTDIGMRGMSGMVLADAAGQFRTDLHTLFVTGHAFDSEVVNHQFPDGTDILFKPFSLQAFEDKVRALLREVPQQGAQPLTP